MTVPESQLPVEVTVWVPLVLVHLTVSPTLMTTGLGLKPKLKTEAVTVFGPGVVVVDACTEVVVIATVVVVDGGDAVVAVVVPGGVVVVVGSAVVVVLLVMRTVDVVVEEIPVVATVDCSGVIRPVVVVVAAASDGEPQAAATNERTAIPMSHLEGTFRWVIEHSVNVTRARASKCNAIDPSRHPTDCYSRAEWGSALRDMPKRRWWPETRLPKKKPWSAGIANFTRVDPVWG